MLDAWYRSKSPERGFESVCSVPGWNWSGIGDFSTGQGNKEEPLLAKNVLQLDTLRALRKDDPENTYTVKPSILDTDEVVLNTCLHKAIQLIKSLF